MKAPITSACRHCRHYTPEGRRGGLCQQLNVPVQSSWTACSLALPPFTPAWEIIEEMVMWQQQTATLRESLVIQCSDFPETAEDAPGTAARSEIPAASTHNLVGAVAE